MKRIVASVPERLNATLMETILRRPDLQVEFVPGPNVQDFLDDPPDMLIIVHGVVGEGAKFVERLVGIYPNLKFPIVILTGGALDARYPAAVKAVFKTNFQIHKFNAKIAVLLGFPPRRSRRFLVHLGATVSVQSRTVLATITKISGSGCLLECGQKLQVGHTFSLKILGVKDVEIPPLTVSIVREEPPPNPAGKMHRFSAEFVDVKLLEMEAVVRQLVG